MSCHRQIDFQAAAAHKGRIAARASLRGKADKYSRSVRTLRQIQVLLPKRSKHTVDAVIDNMFDPAATKQLCRALYRQMRAWTRGDIPCVLSGEAEINANSLRIAFACECRQYIRQIAAQRAANIQPLFDTIAANAR